MNKKEELIINKLFKIASNQQKILSKFAQLSNKASPEEAYLYRAVQTAGANIGLTLTKINVSSSPEAMLSTPLSNPDVTTVPKTYTVHVGGVPKDKRQKFNDTFRNQVRSQKPELDKSLSVFFDD